MRPSEPDFAVLEYITIAKDSRTVLVIALGGTQAASILQRNGFLDAPVPRASTTASLTISRSKRSGERPRPPRTPCSAPAAASTSTRP